MSLMELSAWRLSYMLNETGQKKGWGRAGTYTEMLYGTEALAKEHGERVSQWGITDAAAVEHVFAVVAVGTPVEVHAFARPRVGIVTKLGRTRPTVRFLRNQDGAVDERPFHFVHFWSVDGESLMPKMRPQAARWDKANLRRTLGLS